MSSPDPADATSLRLTLPMRTDIERWAVAAYPREACGLLIGRREGRRITVLHVRAAHNLNASDRHDRYELDPVDHLAAEEEARMLGLDVVGVWHSHPDEPAVPSETDRKAAWSGWSYVIVSVGEGRARDLRSWRLSDERFIAEDVLP